MNETEFLLALWAVIAAILWIRVVLLHRQEARLRRQLEALEAALRFAKQAGVAGLDGYDSAFDGQPHSSNGDGDGTH